MKAMTSTENVDVDENSLGCYQCYMTSEQCRAARAWLNWPQDHLARAANVGVSTVRDFEAGRREPTRNNLAAMKVALESGGIEFLDDEKTCGIRAARGA
jgi:DNA-binding transcriptional regulator YiaG